MILKVVKKYTKKNKLIKKSTNEHIKSLEKRLKVKY
jgi:hypothetical protein